MPFGADREGSVVLRLLADAGQYVKEIQRAGASFAGFVKTHEQQFRSIGRGMTIAGGAIAAGFGAAVKAGMDFESAMRNVSAVVGATEEQYRQLVEVAREQGRTSVFSAKQAADAMYYLGSAGYDTNQIIASLNDTMTLAAATQYDLAETTRIVVGAINAFGLNAEDANRVANVFAATISKSQATMERLGISMQYIAPIFAEMGWSVEEAAAAAAQFYNMGIDASMAGTSLRMAIVKLLKPTKEAEQALAKYGLTADDVNPKVHSLADIIETFESVSLDATDAVDIFGSRAGPFMARLISKGADGLREFTKQITGTNEAMRQYNEQMKATQNQLKLLRSAIIENLIKVFDILKPTLDDFVKRLTAIITEFGKWAEAHPKLAKRLVETTVAVGGLILALGPLIYALPGLVNGFGLLKVGAINLAGAIGNVAKVFGAFVAANPLLAVALAATAGLIAVVTDRVHKWRQAVNEAREAQKKLQEQINQTIEAGWEYVGKYLGKSVEEAVKEKNVTEELSKAKKALKAEIIKLRQSKDADDEVTQTVIKNYEKYYKELDKLDKGVKEYNRKLEEKKEKEKADAEIIQKIAEDLKKKYLPDLANLIAEGADANKIFEKAVEIYGGLEKVLEACGGNIDLFKEGLKQAMPTVQEAGKKVRNLRDEIEYLTVSFELEKEEMKGEVSLETLNEAIKLEEKRVEQAKKAYEAAKDEEKIEKLKELQDHQKRLISLEQQKQQLEEKGRKDREEADKKAKEEREKRIQEEWNEFKQAQDKKLAELDVERAKRAITDDEYYERRLQMYDEELDKLRKLYTEDSIQYQTALLQKLQFYREYLEQKDVLTWTQEQEELMRSIQVEKDKHQWRQTLFNIWQDSVKSGYAFLAGIVDTFYKGVVSNIMDVIKGTKSWQEAFTELGKTLIYWMVEFIAKLLIAKAIMKAMSEIAGGGLLGFIGEILGLEKGGIVGLQRGAVATKPIPAIVGEVPEAVIPLEKLPQVIGSLGETEFEPATVGAEKKVSVERVIFEVNTTFPPSDPEFWRRIYREGLKRAIEEDTTRWSR